MNVMTEHNTGVLNAALQDLGRAERKLSEQQAKQRAKLADLQMKHETANAPLIQEIADLREKIAMYAEANREELTGGNSTIPCSCYSCGAAFRLSNYRRRCK